MTIRPPSGIPLPELVLVANRILAEEAEALRAALEDFSNAPQPGCPWELDGKAISDQVGPEAHGRAELLRYARHQAVLIYVNAYDHLLTLGRIRFRHRAGAGAGPAASSAAAAHPASTRRASSEDKGDQHFRGLLVLRIGTGKSLVILRSSTKAL